MYLRSPTVHNQYNCFKTTDKEFMWSPRQTVNCYSQTAWCVMLRKTNGGMTYSKMLPLKMSLGAMSLSV